MHSGWKHLINPLNNVSTKKVAEWLPLIYDINTANWHGKSSCSLILICGFDF